MNSKLALITAIVFLAFAFGRLETVYAQESLPKEVSCQQSAQEILSEINAVYRLSPATEKVLIAGEVLQSQLITTEKPLSLTEALAMVGGVTRYARRSVYVLERVSESESKIRLEIDLREIYKGRAADPKVEKGDVVYVPRRCSAGKTLPFTDAPIKPLRLIDAPIRFPNVPFAQERPKDE